MNDRRIEDISVVVALMFPDLVVLTCPQILCLPGDTFSTEQGSTHFPQNRNVSPVHQGSHFCKEYLGIPGIRGERGSPKHPKIAQDGWEMVQYGLTGPGQEFFAEMRTFLFTKGPSQRPLSSHWEGLPRMPAPTVVPFSESLS